MRIPILVLIIVLGLIACQERTVARTTGSTRDLSGRRQAAEGTESTTDYARVDACMACMAPEASTDGLKRVATTTGPTNDRDLGQGAGKERLGDRQPGEDGGEAGSGERYARLHDNPFVNVAMAGGDASTFSLDVDSASYSNCRRFLQGEHRLPPADAVRLEELVNTIAYAYPGPSADELAPFRATASLAPCPWADGHLLVRLAVKAREVARDARPPLNLVFLVDTSGSMQDQDKLPLVQRSLNLLAEQLGPRDRLALVTYAGSAGTALAATPGDHQREIRAAIGRLSAGGSTNGAGGIEAAYAEAAKGMMPGGISRVMLCTDGDFNVGISGGSELKALIERKRATGIGLNVYGFGMGNLRDDNLEMLADAGDGCYAYIDGDDEARRLLAYEVMGQLVTVAKDAKVQVFFNPTAVASWRLLGYEDRILARQDFNDDRVDAGDIGAGHTVTALYEIVPAGADATGGVGATGDDNPFIAHQAPAGGDASRLLRLRLRWKEPTASASRLLELDLPSHAAAMDGEFSFASAVAGFGMLLRGSPHRGSCDWAMVESLARDGLGGDPRGQRREFLDLVARARALAR